MDHRPIMFSMPLSWTWWHAKRPSISKLKRHVQESMHHAWRQQTPDWQNAQAHLQAACQHMPSTIDDYAQLASKALSMCAKTFGSSLKRADRPHQSLIAQLSRHYRLLRRPGICNLASTFRAWNHFRFVMKLKAQLSHACREAKRDRLQRFVNRATEAAALHDSRKLYGVIRELTPKQPFRLIRLKGPQGAALSAPHEVRLLESHFAPAVFTKLISHLLHHSCNPSTQCHSRLMNL